MLHHLDYQTIFAGCRKMFASKNCDKIVYYKTLITYGELDPMSEHRTQSPFKAKREHIAMVYIPNLAYLN